MHKKDMHWEVAAGNSNLKLRTPAIWFAKVFVWDDNDDGKHK